jgi:hypothetical protein
VNSFDAQDPLPFRGVVIDQPGTNVVLILGATGATHWRFSVLPGSSLAGVWVTGRQPVQLENLPANVVLLDAAHVTDDCAAAGSSDGINPANEAILAVLRQVPEMTFQSADQWTQVRSGRTPFSAQRAVQTPDSSRRGQDTEAALRGLLERGAIRRMSMQDVDHWRATHSANLRFAARTDMFAPRTDEPQLRVFMVQQAMEFPEGLTGAHMATFIVPPGVPSPTGDRGHSQVIDLNQ